MCTSNTLPHAEHIAPFEFENAFMEFMHPVKTVH